MEADELERDKKLFLESAILESSAEIKEYYKSIADDEARVEAVLQELIAITPVLANSVELTMNIIRDQLKSILGYDPL